MAKTIQHILLIEDSPTLGLTYQAYLKPLKLKVTHALTGQKGVQYYHEKNPNVVILDLKLPDMAGLDILKLIKKSQINCKVIVITAHGSIAVAVEAMQEGATDFILKPFTAERLTTTVKNTLELQRLSTLIGAEHLSEDEKFGKFIGKSPQMHAVYRMIKDAAPSRASVFITGESGTGKDICAEVLHEKGPRAGKPFVALNCAAIPATLIESEIFGYKKGAFTGATEDRQGAAKRADGGTLFLDEICEMPMDLQAKLLRFIQTGQIVPIGGSEAETVNVRFICATNQIPWHAVQARKFREDLYYRLHVIPIHLPPLRQRNDDIIILAESFLRRFSKEENKDLGTIDKQAREILLAYGWPGNVRELANVIQSAVVLGEGSTLTKSMLIPLLGPGKTVQTDEFYKSQVDQQNSWTDNDFAPVNSEIITLAEAERSLIERALRLKDDNITRAAACLGVHPTTLYRKIKSWQ